MIEQTLSKAQAQARKGNIEHAIALCEKVLILYPENNRAKDALKKLRMQNGKLEENIFQNWLRKVKLLLQSENYPTLYNEAKYFSNEHPRFFEAWMILGTAAAQLNKLEEAETALKIAISLKPENIEAQNNLGLCFIKNWQLEKAMLVFDKIISARANYAEAHSNKGVTLFKFGKYKESIASFETAIIIRPNFSSAHANLGRALHKIGLLQKAETSLRTAIRLNEFDADAYFSIGLIQIEKNELEMAKESLIKALSISPKLEEAQHLLAALNGQTSSTAPRTYVEKLFDDYAADFDYKLSQELSYKTPKRLFEIITNQSMPAKTAKILDLGCGTGLFGEQIYGSCEAIDGVDLSRGMLEKAKQKNIYKNLYQSDIEEYLKRADLAYDFFIFADVFVYIGDLRNIFSLIKSRVKSPATIAFSTEHELCEGYLLKASGRYAHSYSYIEQICNQFDLNLHYFEEVNLRKEKTKFIQGGLYLLQH